MFDIVRYSFFQAPNGGSLRFTEASPHRHQEERSICNCTRAVADRPPGAPSSRSQFLTVRPFEDDRTVLSYSSVGDWRDAHFYQDGEPKGRRLIVDDSDLWKPSFRVTFQKNRMSIHQVLGEREACSAKVFRGRDVDTSKLVNGWIPSEIVPKAPIAPDDLWVHDSLWGEEALEILPATSRESAAWKALFEEEERFWALVSPACHDLDGGLVDLRLALDASCETRTAARSLGAKINLLYQTFRASEMCALAAKIAARTKMLVEKRDGITLE